VSIRLASGALALGLPVAARSNSAASVAASSNPGGTVTFALPVGSVPTYIFPFVSGPESNNVEAGLDLESVTVMPASTVPWPVSLT
jgi:hypothetical protein